jgi:hypothetical protein
MFLLDDTQNLKNLEMVIKVCGLYSLAEYGLAGADILLRQSPFEISFDHGSHSDGQSLP